MKFLVGDKAFLKLSLVKGVRRFNIRGNLSARYIGSYEIIEKLNLVASRLDLPVHGSETEEDLRNKYPCLFEANLRFLSNL